MNTYNELIIAVIGFGLGFVIAYWVKGKILA